MTSTKRAFIVCGLVLFSEALVSAKPFIFHRGITNAASFTPAGLPNGNIARGGIFSIFGRQLGPAPGVQTSSFPLPNVLAGVSVEVCKDQSCLAVIPLYVSAGQINALMPSNAPLGSVVLRVTYNGEAGNYSPALVASWTLGIFAVSSGGFGPGIVTNFIAQDNQPVNSALATARPGQVVTLWATGLGPGLNADNVAPQPGDLPTQVEVFVGGKTVTNRLYSGRSPCCSGVDQIVFSIPDDAPNGCYVPVHVRTGGSILSNTVTIAIESNGAACHDDNNPLQTQFSAGGSYALAVVEQANARIEFEQDLAIEVDAGAAYVAARRETGSPYFYNPVMSLPPPGACATFSMRANTIGSGTPPGFAATASALQAGSPIQVQGADALGFRPSREFPDVQVSSLHASSSGPVMISAPGGSDIGAFSATVTNAGGLTWTNRDQIAAIDRSEPLRIEWSAPSGASNVAIIGANYDVAADAWGAFVCFAPSAAGAFDVPDRILGALPASRDSAAFPWGRLYVVASPPGGVSEFQANGLSRGLALLLRTAGRTVTYR